MLWFSVRISLEISTVMTKVFRGLPQSSMRMLTVYLVSSTRVYHRLVRLPLET